VSTLHPRRLIPIASHNALAIRRKPNLLDYARLALKDSEQVTIVSVPYARLMVAASGNEAVGHQNKIAQA